MVKPYKSAEKEVPVYFSYIQTISEEDVSTTVPSPESIIAPYVAMGYSENAVYNAFTGLGRT